MNEHPTQVGFSTGGSNGPVYFASFAVNGNTSLGVGVNPQTGQVGVGNNSSGFYNFYFPGYNYDVAAQNFVNKTLPNVRAQYGDEWRAASGGLAYGNKFARELQNQYENGNGVDYHLSKERLYDIYDKSIINGALEWNKAKLMGNNIYKVPINLYKTDYALSFGRASLSIYNDFSGKIYPTGFYDTWDLDPKSWGIRSYPAEVITRYYNWSLNGTNFEITYP